MTWLVDILSVAALVGALLITVAVSGCAQHHEVKLFDWKSTTSQEPLRMELSLPAIRLNPSLLPPSQNPEGESSKGPQGS